MSFIDVYLNYSCYNRLKVYYERSQLTGLGRGYLGESIDVLKKGGINTSPYYKLFEELARLFSGDDASIRYGIIPSCIYINYLLNKNMRANYGYLYNEESFKILKLFDHNYSIKKYNNLKNSCESYIRFLDTNEYKSMDVLYELYYLYDQLVSSNIQNNIGLSCAYISLLARHYRNILDIPNVSKFLLSKLESLKELIVEREKNFKLKCSLTLPQITLPTEDTTNSVGHYGKKNKNKKKDYMEKHNMYNIQYYQEQGSQDKKLKTHITCCRGFLIEGLTK
ncbi:CYIR protein [Plasmodium cynomolgi strain B]|uniref:CYIR protein n=1 Tax=Plasmodium cynomolgi (strain B) TaxID=1120755 RepID=K6VJ80_PLACD|nr:CYIR protein [Plasmodium cynomolgi strain B]GAB69452.1 CYIR protein [Plasmodium cynomolgi strain B]